MSTRDPYAEPPADRTRILPVVERGGRGPAAPPAARTAPPGQPQRSRWPRRVLLALGLAFLALVIGLVTLSVLAWSRIEKVDAIPADAGGAVSAGRVYLLVGSDSREDLTPEDRVALGTGSVEGRRTDTIMLLHLPEDGSGPALVSIPRDSLVDIPGVGTQRINAAYAFGGPALLVETLQAETGVAIDDYIEIGLGGFAGIVDAVGGVRLCLDEPIADERAHIDLPAGCQVLAGPDALGYARARYSDPRGDLGRVERQREVLGAIAGEAASPATLLNPVSAFRLATAGGDALRIDQDTGPVDLARFAWGMRSISGGGGTTLTVPIGEVANTVTWDEEQADQLWAALQNGTAVPPDLLDDPQN